MTGRIDVHQHVIPAEYAATLSAHGLREAGVILLANAARRRPGHAQ